uniref:Uncharacterized protein n=1 Tax=Trichogramma kaykai TaxID=54128 RepID=A0ABD2W8M0_9HYME
MPLARKSNDIFGIADKSSCHRLLSRTRTDVPSAMRSLKKSAPNSLQALYRYFDETYAKWVQHQQRLRSVTNDDPRYKREKNIVQYLSDISSNIKLS